MIGYIHKDVDTPEKLKQGQTLFSQEGDTDIIQKTLNEQLGDLKVKDKIIDHRLIELDRELKKLDHIVTSIANILCVTKENNIKINNNYYNLEILLWSKKGKNSDDSHCMQLRQKSTTTADLYAYFRNDKSAINIEISRLKNESVELKEKISVLSKQYNNYLDDKILLKRIHAHDSSDWSKRLPVDNEDPKQTNRFDRHQDYKWLRLGVGVVCIFFISIALYLGS